MRKLKNFKGVTGSIAFDNKGDPIKAKYFVLQFEKRSYPGKVVKVIEQQAPGSQEVISWTSFFRLSFAGSAMRKRGPLIFLTREPMKKKLRVAILFGGKSAEHGLSVISARNIVEAMNKKENTKSFPSASINKDAGSSTKERGFSITASKRRSSFSAVGIPPPCCQEPHKHLCLRRVGHWEKWTWCFSVLHGPFGEDGTVQGLLKLANVPFCRRRTPRFRGGHGQGRDETVTPRRQHTESSPNSWFLSGPEGVRSTLWT